VAAAAGARVAAAEAGATVAVAGLLFLLEELHAPASRTSAASRAAGSSAETRRGAMGVIVKTFLC
jgi:hypothetical protein